MSDNARYRLKNKPVKYSENLNCIGFGEGEGQHKDTKNQQAIQKNICITAKGSRLDYLSI
jgi:hypothetical protein